LEAGQGNKNKKFGGPVTKAKKNQPREHKLYT
jgi:hypothetical protein